MDLLLLKKQVIVLYYLVIIPSQLFGATSSAISPDRRSSENAPLFARWLVSRSSWGVLTTLGPKGLPFGNVASFTDNEGTGIPYFLLAVTRDDTGKNALRNPTSCFTISEYALGSCNGSIIEDPQSPFCAKIVLNGQLNIILENSDEAIMVEQAFLEKHPQFKDVPNPILGDFRFFKLKIEKIYLVNYYAPPRKVTVDQYLYLNL